MNSHSMRIGDVLAVVLTIWGGASASARVQVPTHQGREAHANVQDIKESEPGASTKEKVTKPKSALLPIGNRQAIKTRLSSVRAEIEKIEDEMFTLTDKHNDSLVTSRDRWHSELDRVQTEIRLADKDLAQAATKSVETKKRIEELRAKSKEQQENDGPLKTLEDKLTALHEKRGRIAGDKTNIKEKARPSMLDSVTGEIIDTDMEIAQRKESLRLSYKGGEAEQFEKQIKDLEVDVEVKRSAKIVLEERFKSLQKLSEDITAYARLERKVDELQILHRKLAELNAQQEVEYLKSTDPNKVEVAVGTAK